MTDDIEVDDHLTIKDRGDERRIPNSGISLYVDNNIVKAVDADGNRTLPVEGLTLGNRTLTYDSVLDTLVVVE